MVWKLPPEARGSDSRSERSQEMDGARATRSRGKTMSFMFFQNKLHTFPGS